MIRDGAGGRHVGRPAAARERPPFLVLREPARLVIVPTGAIEPGGHMTARLPVIAAVLAASGCAARETGSAREYRSRVARTEQVDPLGSTRVVLLAEGAPAARSELSIIVGPSEGAAIARAIEGTRAPRPMTHDLLAAVIERLGAKVRRLTVTRLEGGVFFAELVLETASEMVSLDARPSDGLALAIAASAPIYVSDRVLLEAGRPPGTSDDEDESPAPNRPGNVI